MLPFLDIFLKALAVMAIISFVGVVLTQLMLQEQEQSISIVIIPLLRACMLQRIFSAAQAKQTTIACPGQANNYRQTVTIKLYANQNGICYLGAVRYGHINLNLELANGLQNITKSNYRIGTTVSPKLCDSGCCYVGIHLHMQRESGISLVTCSQQNINAGTTAIYKFTVASCPS